MGITQLKACIVVITLSLIALQTYAQTIEVKIYKKRFTPEKISINKGDTVRWINMEKRQYHNVWFKESGEEEPQYFFPEETYEKTFNEEGLFNYECGPHPKMKGSVQVSDAKKALSQERIAELRYLVKQDCGSCHGMLFKGGWAPVYYHPT